MHVAAFFNIDMDVFLRVAQFMVLQFSGLNKEDPNLLLFIFENK